MGRLKPSVKLAAKELQYLVRVEAALIPMQFVIKKGKPELVFTELGEAACVTCGVVLPFAREAWEGNQLQGGHCLAGCQSTPAAYLDERNVHPQCSQCNKYRSGAGMEYEQFMALAYPVGTLDELRQKKNGVIKGLDDAGVISLREQFRSRSKAAEQKLERYGYAN